MSKADLPVLDAFNNPIPNRYHTVLDSTEDGRRIIERTAIALSPYTFYDFLVSLFFLGVMIGLLWLIPVK